MRSASWSCGLHSTFTKQRCNDHITRMAGSHQNRITSTSDDHSAIRHCDRSPPFMLHMRITQTARSLYGNLMSSTGESCADCSHSALTIRAQFMCAAGSRPNNFPAKLPTYCHQKRNLAIEKRNLQQQLLCAQLCCRFRFSVAKAVLTELRVVGFSAQDGETVFPLFVANPRTVRLCGKKSRCVVPLGYWPSRCCQQTQTKSAQSEPQQADAADCEAVDRKWCQRSGFEVASQEADREVGSDE